MFKYCSRLKPFRQLLIASLPLLLIGCQHVMNSGESHYPAACAGNAYLTKYDCSIERIQRAAEEGSADAQYALGYMYYYGISTMRDQQTAVLWIQRAADQGQSLAKKALMLIRNGAHFTDLHHAVGGRRGRSGGSSLHQPHADVAVMNTTIPEQPLTNHLPNYKPRTGKQKKAPVLDVLKHKTDTKVDSTAKKPGTTHTKRPVIADPRLSQHAKPIVAHKISKKSDGYTLQLMGSHQLSALKSYAKKHSMTRKVHYFKTKLHKKPWYVMTYGHFNTYKQAEKALHTLPNRVKHIHPWVKSIQALRREVRLQKVVG